jgi:hypothetical protein
MAKDMENMAKGQTNKHRKDPAPVYAGGMVPDHGGFGSAPSKGMITEYPHMEFGLAGLSEHLDDGISGMDRRTVYGKKHNKPERY